MLAKTLKRIIDKQFTSAKEISELTGVSQSTVYRWIAGQSQPDFDSVRLLVRLLPDKRAQKALLRRWESEPLERAVAAGIQQFAEVCRSGEPVRMVAAFKAERAAAKAKG